MSIKFEIIDLPAGVHKRSKHEELRKALLNLPVGQAINIPRDVLRGQAENTLQMKRVCGRACHQRTVEGFIYIWLDQETSA